MGDDVSNAGQLRKEGHLLVHGFVSRVVPYSRLCPPQGESLFAFFPPCPCASFILKRNKAASRKSIPLVSIHVSE